jgi:hypothetical protein
MGYESIAFPALATGVAELSPEQSAVAIILETAAHLVSATRLRTVTLALYPRPGLPQDILPRFYTQVQKLLDLTQPLEAVAVSLAKLERVYREMESTEAADEVVRTRENLTRQRHTWEREILERELGDRRPEPSWRKYREEMEPELERISALRRPRRDLERLRSEPTAERSWEQLNSEYAEYRSAALREMILIRKRTITDLETELTVRGFAPDLKRMLERETDELNKLELELKELLA